MTTFSVMVQIENDEVYRLAMPVVPVAGDRLIFRKRIVKVNSRYIAMPDEPGLVTFHLYCETVKFVEREDR